MTQPPRLLVARPATRPTALLAALLLALAWLTLGALPSPAHAHDALVLSDPADGATLETAPSTATLTFSNEIGQVGIAFALTDATGTTHSLPTVPKLAGAVVEQPLPALGAGSYTLEWRVVSSDGHPISGAIHFQVTVGVAATTEAATSAPGGETAPAATAAPAVTPAPGGASGLDGLPSWAPWVAGIGGLAVLAGAVLAARAAKRHRDRFDDGR